MSAWTPWRGVLDMAKIPTFDARAPRQGTVSGYADDGSANAWATLASTAGQISGRLGKMADKAVVREQTEAGTIAASQVSMPTVDFAFGETMPAGPWKEQAKALLRHEEGFRAQPYWDVNAHRVGYGSDTTFVNGKPIAVTPGMKITREQAEADLDYRLSGREGAQVQKQLGDTWQQMPDNVRAALASVGYNYGSLPSNVVTAAKSGDVEALAAAVGGLSANPERRAREAALIRNSANGGVSVKISGSAGPMPQRAGNTLAAESFNAAAGQIYMNRLDTSMRAQVNALEIQHGEDPAALDDALQAMRAGFIADLLPEAAATFDANFEARRVSAIGSAVKRAQANFENDLLASYEDKIMARRDSAMRLATNAGADPAQDQLIASELAAISADIDASPMTALAKTRAKRDLEQDVLKARVLGGFDAQGGAADRAAYLERFQQEWKGGEGFGGRVSHDEYERINSAMIKAVQRDQVEAQKRVSQIDKAIETQTGYLEKGLPVPADVRASMQQAVAQSGDESLAQRMDFFDRLSEWQQAHTGAKPEVLAAQIDQLEARIARDGATDPALTTLSVMQGLQKQMTLGLKEDPLGWASRAGVANIAPIDASSAESLTASLASRVSDAQAVASHYGTHPVYFRPAERAALIKAAADDPLMLPQMAGSMIAAFGADTPAVLAELSSDAPVLAHIADLQHRTGNEGLTVEAAEALAMRKAEGYKSALPGQAKLQSAATPMIGPAIGHAPKAANAMMETATAIFEYRAARRGIDPSNVNVAGDPANDLFIQAMDEAAGARIIGGVKHGGMTEVNGRMTIAPEDMPAEGLQRLVNQLTDADLMFQQEIVSANGVPISARAIANGTMIYAGPGRYHVALGDVAGGDPRFVATRDGRRWTLDVNMLRTTRHDR